MPVGDTSGLSGAPRACWGHFRLVRGTTDLSGPRGTSGLAGAPQACQGHHRPSRGTIGLAGAPWACQGHHGPVVGISGLSGAPQSFQGHHKPVKGHLRPSRAGAQEVCSSWGGGGAGTGFHGMQLPTTHRVRKTHRVLVIRGAATP